MGYSEPVEVLVEIRQSVAATHPGRRRAVNEDRVLRLAGERVFAVADGMGGPGIGDVAATLVIEAVHAGAPALEEARAVLESGASSEARVGVTDALNQIFLDANERVHAEARRLGRSDMGSALVVMTFVGNLAYIAHVGHGRAYLYRGGRLTGLTEDHSLAELRYRRGRMTRAEYASSPDRHVLYQALGTSVDLDVDIAEVRLMDGDVLLLCSDGLTRVVSDEVLEGLIAPDALPSTLRRLVGAANEAGGPDNVSTVVVSVRVEEDVSTAVLRAGLAEAHLLRDLNGPERLMVAPYLEERRLLEGEVLLADGAYGDRAYVVLEGTLAWKRGPRVLVSFGRGETAGVQHLAREAPHQGELVATSHARVVELKRDRFRELLRQKPDIGARVALALLDDLGLRMRDMADRLQAIERVARGE
jgi:serine/threonine protein phosphatase PrpC